MKDSFCAELVHGHDRDRFLASLFVPAAEREGLLALYALNVELSRIRAMVSEEMIGHVRLAWWQEAVDALYTGKTRQGQPVLEALAKVIDSGYMPQADMALLLETYREHFPETPPNVDQVMEKLSLVYFALACPQAEASWRKAHQIITRHRHRFGKRMNSWLVIRLLVAGR